MAWVTISKARIVKDDVTGEVGVLTECGSGESNVKVVGSASATDIDKAVNNYL